MPTFKQKLEMAKQEGEERIAAHTTKPMEPVVEDKPKKKPAAKKPAAKKKATTKKEK